MPIPRKFMTTFDHKGSPVNTVLKYPTEYYVYSLGSTLAEIRSFSLMMDDGSQLCDADMMCVGLGIDIFIYYM